ncbi:MAG: glucose-1-phosphate thymidylyltransferase [Gammaproteobacteria bacterium RIFCSPHIGHO2_12_FULL_36_30]|nr:MAG: glucose-1-phosphate thymidylyltransferase [Gammaproteobacteria bacterium RIFCSPHIGHO2_12_FULL_36_30]
MSAKKTKGILLAGGTGSRLYPLTFSVNKSLLPVYDKPLIYYPLSVLMLAGIHEILIITNEKDIQLFKQQLGNGAQWGISLQYQIQSSPNGIAESLIIAEDFIGNDSVCLILGDNIFYGQGLAKLLQASVQCNIGATIFGYYVSDPERYGVISFDENRKIKDIIEKPLEPDSNYAVPGLYIYDAYAIQIAKALRPSARNELEITDINKIYLKEKRLKVTFLSRGIAWMDVGTHNALIEAGQYVEIIERRQGLKIACLEEISWRMGFTDTAQLLKQAEKYGRNNSYGCFLYSLIENTSLQFLGQDRLVENPELSLS